MSNTSATGGYLQPGTTPTPLEGQSLEDFLQQVFSGIVGLSGDLVRPRWQQQPPNLPDISTDWMAYGITRHVPEAFAYDEHDGSGLGTDYTARHEVLELLLSFYGPNADANAALLSDGFQVPQNREAMQLVGMGLVATGDIRLAPEMLKNQWLRRVDMEVTLRRQIRRSYPVLSLVAAQGTIYYDTTPQLVSTIDVHQ